MLNISDKINSKYTEVLAQLTTVNKKIQTATTNRKALVAKREKLKDMLAKLKAIQVQSAGFNKLEDN